MYEDIQVHGQSVKSIVYHVVRMNQAYGRVGIQDHA